MTNNCRSWIDAHRDDIIRDIKRLVDVKSVKDVPLPGAPYGAGVRAVQNEAMALCREAGLAVTDLDGHIAYAHYGDPDRFIAIVAHLDVVPEGGGWDSDPYCLTERDGYLVGRGVGDDKGPFVLSLWAIRYLMEHKISLRYGIRLIIGLDEETGMSDLLYYNEHCGKPVFAFTPDSQFPVGHGEKGIYASTLVSPPIAERAILDIAGGVASNVVPDSARAILRFDLAETIEAAATGRADITVTASADGVRVDARGIARHAGNPHGGVSAIHVLLAFLLESGVLSGCEASAVRFMENAAGDFSGSQFGIDCDDGIFTPLTIIAGLISMRDDCFALNVNCRYPTVIPPDVLESRVAETAAQNGFTVTEAENSGPFYLPPSHPAVSLLCDIYNEITGSNEKPIVMSGGTYARHMENAVSYGIEPPVSDDPEWVGTAHMKNEAISIELALQACEIFIHTLAQLQEIDL